MVITVARKPIAVCAVSAVPTRRAFAYSLTQVEKTPESAMTAAPHTKRNIVKTALETLMNTGEATQQAALMVSAVTAAWRRPNRSAAQPPSRHPNTPASPMTENAMTPGDVAAVSPRSCWPARMNNTSHVHIA